MGKSSDELLDLRFGGATIAENLSRAVASGELIENNDGTLSPRPVPDNERVNWMYVHSKTPMGCRFLMDFLFKGAYAKSAVPYGCRACYKVKVIPRTLRELAATWQIARGIECNSKWGIDLYNPHSQNLYAGYFYASGLDGARVISKVAREAFASDARIGSEIPMTIKRGCSEYEAALGRSDRYEFTPEMAELESYLKSRFREGKRSDRLNAALAFWIDLAFRIGDDTYLDFTGGKRLRPAMLAYDP